MDKRVMAVLVAMTLCVALPGGTITRVVLGQELVPLKPEEQRCVGETYFYKGDEEIFKAIDRASYDTKIPAKNALYGAFYTENIQIAYVASDSEVNPWPVGTYRGCPYGCIKSLFYLGHEFRNVCIPNYLCAQGATTTPYCDPARGNDVYYDYQTFFCAVVTLAAMTCPPGSRCVQTSSGCRCMTIPGYVGSGEQSYSGPIAHTPGQANLSGLSEGYRVVEVDTRSPEPLVFASGNTPCPCAAGIQRPAGGSEQGTHDTAGATVLAAQARPQAKLSGAYARASVGSFVWRAVQNLVALALVIAVATVALW